MPDYSLNMSIDLTWFKCNMLYSRWAAKNGMGYPEMMVLYGLYAFKCSSQKEIAEHCGIVKQTVNTVVHDLEKHGLIEMTPSKTDKRSRIISLTDAGLAYAMEKIGPFLIRKSRFVIRSDLNAFLQPLKRFICSMSYSNET